MKTYTLTEDQANDLRCEEPPEGMTVIESGDWDDEGKYQNLQVVFEVDGVCYALYISRSGSYFSDYNYEYELDCSQVVQEEIKRTIWVHPKEVEDE